MFALIGDGKLPWTILPLCPKLIFSLLHKRSQIIKEHIFMKVKLVSKKQEVYLSKPSGIASFLSWASSLPSYQNFIVET